MVQCTAFKIHRSNKHKCFIIISFYTEQEMHSKRAKLSLEDGNIKSCTHVPISLIAKWLGKVLQNLITSAAWWLRGFRQCQSWEFKVTKTQARYCCCFLLCWLTSGKKILLMCCSVKTFALLTLCDMIRQQEISLR